MKDIQPAVDALYTRVFAGKGESKEPAFPPDYRPHDLSDQQLIDAALRARSGARFARLWAGRTEEYNGDDSSADMALVNDLTFWCGPDPDRIDRMFRQSGLCREKWTEREDYRDRTIGRAPDSCRNFYTPRHQSNGNGKHEGSGKPASEKFTGASNGADQLGDNLTSSSSANEPSGNLSEGLPAAPEFTDPEGGLVLDPKNPMPSARPFLARKCALKDGPTLLNSNGSLYRWTSPAYAERSPTPSASPPIASSNPRRSTSSAARWRASRHSSPLLTVSMNCWTR